MALLALAAPKVIGTPWLTDSAFSNPHHTFNQCCINHQSQPILRVSNHPANKESVSHISPSPANPAFSICHRKHGENGVIDVPLPVMGFDQVRIQLRDITPYNAQYAACTYSLVMFDLLQRWDFQDPKLKILAWGIKDYSICESFTGRKMRRYWRKETR